MIDTIDDVEFGAELGPWQPNTELPNTSAFADAVGWGGAARFTDHEGARKEGMPGALVPGIMGLGFLTTLIRRWAPRAEIKRLDAVFRAPLLADEPCYVSAVVTDIDDNRCELDLVIKNDADETRQLGTAIVELPSA